MRRDLLPGQSILSREERLNQAKAWGITTQERYEHIVDAMATVRLVKVHQYGEGRFSLDISIRASFALLWANLQRKFQRATRDLIERKTFDKDLAIDTYLDGANYFLMVLEVGDSEEWL